MDIEMLVSFLFVLTILTLASSFVYRIVNRNLEHKERIKLAHGNANGVGRDDYRKLEERVRVLERIATDSNHALATQIEQLRDLQELDAIEHKQEAAR